MKVKVRKRKPVPVAAKRAIKMLTDAKPNLYSVVRKSIRSKSKEFITDNISRKNLKKCLTNDDIEWYCRDSFLMEIPIKMLADCVNSNIFTKENGEKIALVPSLWIWNWITSD